MAQLENINAIEKRLWNAADTLRSNSNYASNEYFLPVTNCWDPGARKGPRLVQDESGAKGSSFASLNLPLPNT